MCFRLLSLILVTVVVTACLGDVRSPQDNFAEIAESYDKDGSVSVGSDSNTDLENAKISLSPGGAGMDHADGVETLDTYPFDRTFRASLVPDLSLTSEGADPFETPGVIGKNTRPLFGAASTLESLTEEVAALEKRLTEEKRKREGEDAPAEIVRFKAITLAKGTGGFTDALNEDFSRGLLTIRLSKHSTDDPLPDGVRASMLFPKDDSHKVSVIFDGVTSTAVTLPEPLHKRFQYVSQVQRVVHDHIIQVGTFPYGIAGIAQSLDLSDRSMQDLLFVAGLRTEVCHTCVSLDMENKRFSKGKIKSEYLPQATLTLHEDMYLYCGALAHQTIGFRDPNVQDLNNGLNFNLGTWSESKFFNPGSRYNVQVTSMLGVTITNQGRDFYLPSIEWLHITEYPVAQARRQEVLLRDTHFEMTHYDDLSKQFVSADRLNTPAAGYPFLIQNKQNAKIMIGDGSDIEPRDFDLRIEGAFFGPEFEGLGAVYTYKINHGDNGVDQWHYLWGVLGMYMSDPEHHRNLDHIQTDDPHS